jgi:hypothetical protein
MICECCNKEMKDGVACNPIDIVIGGVSYQLIIYGNETRFPQPFESEYCPDCGTPKGKYHHSTCDIEECPKCHRQLLSCYCGLVSPSLRGEVE